MRNIGLKKGDVVALVSPNLPDTVLGLLGSSSAGLVVTTVNPLYTNGKSLYVISNIFFIRDLYTKYKKIDRMKTRWGSGRIKRIVTIGGRDENFQRRYKGSC